MCPICGVRKSSSADGITCINCLQRDVDASYKTNYGDKAFTTEQQMFLASVNRSFEEMLLMFKNVGLKFKLDITRIE